MKISKNFRLREFTSTSYDVPNQPNEYHIINICALVHNILEPIRIKLNYPIQINSGYRNDKLNKLVGGSETSQHKLGQAADITSIDNLQLFYLIYFFTDFDQLIWYDDGSKKPVYIHVSYNILGNNKQVLRAKKISGKTKYQTFYL